MAADAIGPLAAGTPVGIVGAGTMGAGIAQVAVLAGHPVVLFDSRAGASEAALSGIHAAVAKLHAKGRVTAGQAAFARSHLCAAAALQEFSPCGLVIEAIVEDLRAKQDLFRELEMSVARNAILASNTSSLSITSIAACLGRPERLAGMHFFNPAPSMALVEVISGAVTAPHVAETLRATATAWGKVPVLARSTPGFIVNRIARPFYAEALRVLEEGGADCATIDAVLREAGGFRMGPFELMDLIGIDVNYAVTRSVFDGFYGDPRFTPSLRQRELVEGGFLGRKTGRGFFRYEEGASAPPISTHPPVAPPMGVRVFGRSEFGERISHCGVGIEREATHADGRIAQCDECVLYCSDGRSATLRAAHTGVRDTLLLDLALDAKSTPRLAVCAADGCAPDALASGVGLLQAAGIAVSLVDDVPGLIVLRTVAMLANEASDAVLHGVADAGDCDLAMRKGVNYPCGPLEWAENLGLTRVVTALDHLATWYGEDRYRVSPLLRRKALAGGRFTGVDDHVR